MLWKMVHCQAQCECLPSLQTNRDAHQQRFDKVVAHFSFFILFIFILRFSEILAFWQTTKRRETLKFDNLKNFKLKHHLHGRCNFIHLDFYSWFLTQTTTQSMLSFPHPSSVFKVGVGPRWAHVFPVLYKLNSSKTLTILKSFIVIPDKISY